MPKENDKDPASLLYWNDMLMEKIIGNVEVFKDRNSLELSCRRLRDLSLKTPIFKRDKYAIRLESDPNWSPFLTLLMRPRVYSSRLSVRTCSDVPDENSCEIVAYNYKDNKQGGELFFEGVRKRLANQIFELEIRNRRFGMRMLNQMEKFPNLKRIIIINARDHIHEALQEPGENVINDRIESLDLVLDRQWCIEIERMKRLIGPNLKHFCCHINPSPSKSTWFIEEVMVEVALHDIRLETCQLYFLDPQMPYHLITALIGFMADRSKSMQVFISDNFSKSKCQVPKVSLKFRNDDDNTLRLITESCPEVLQKAESIEVTNIHQQNLISLSIAMPKFYSVKELHLSGSLEKRESCLIDGILISLPSSLHTLCLDNWKFTPSSIDILADRCGKTLQTLCLVNNGFCNTVQNFNRILDEFEELQALQIDMCITHLMFAKVVKHPKLQKLHGYVPRSTPEKSLLVLRSHFDNVTLKRIDRHRQQLTVSK